jgi:hypothetical protein
MCYSQNLVGYLIEEKKVNFLHNGYH